MDATDSRTVGFSIHPEVARLALAAAEHSKRCLKSRCRSCSQR